jgi:hypothetical protein
MKKACGCPKNTKDTDSQRVSLLFNGMRPGISLGWATHCGGCWKWTIHPTDGIFVAKEESEESEG